MRCLVACFAVEGRRAVTHARAHARLATACCLAASLLFVPVAAAASAPLQTAGAKASSEARILESTFHAIAFGDSFANVRDRLDPHCDELRIVEVVPPRFPLARTSEKHLVARRLTASSGDMLDSIAFVFGDDALVLVEARGGAYNTLKKRTNHKPLRIRGYEYDRKNELYLLEREDAAWLLSPEAVHPNLFFWSNPSLPTVTETIDVLSSTAARPAFVQLGGSTASLRPRIDEASIFTNTHESEPTVPTGATTQLQVNAFGIPYAGFPRKFELIFADDRLELVYVLTAKPEEDRIRAALVASYGEPVFVSDVVEAFDDWAIVLRKDKPEVMMLSETLRPKMRAMFAPAAPADR